MRTALQYHVHLIVSLAAYHLLVLAGDHDPAFKSLFFGGRYFLVNRGFHHGLIVLPLLGRCLIFIDVKLDTSGSYRA